MATPSAPPQRFLTQRLNVSGMTGESAKPAIPRPSASLILLNAKNEVLMIQRNLESRSFAGVHAFPGGNLDKEHDASLEITAIRETFEETGILLAAPGSSLAASAGAGLSNEDLNDARKLVHAQKLSFSSFLSRHDVYPATDELLPFTEWITPPPVPRRFHTRFYIAFLPLPEDAETPSRSTRTEASAQIAASTSSSQAHVHRLPTSDGGLEVLSATFIHPSTVLARFRAGALALMPPQVYLLTTLAEVLGDAPVDTDGPSREEVELQRAAIARLAGSAFGRMVINPRALAPPAEEGGRKDGVPKDGTMVLTFEGDETRGGKKGRLHRAVVVPGRGVVPKAVTIIRNFDVFTEVEGHLFPQAVSRGFNAFSGAPVTTLTAHTAKL